MEVYCQVPALTLIADGIFCVLIYEDWQIDFHMASYLPTVSAKCECLEPPDLSDLDDTNEEVDAELQSLSNPWYGEGEGDGAEWPIDLVSSGCNPGLVEVLPLVMVQ